MAETSPTNQRPYLIRAMHEWMVDNDLTPHIVADAAYDGIRVPPEHVKDGKIVLNLSYAATRALVIGNEEIVFEGRFNGTPRQLCVPVLAVLGIYARETGQGMIFSPEDSAPPPDTSGDESSATARPTLKVVK
jgi:stringent starvation protein B